MPLDVLLALGCAPEDELREPSSGASRDAVADANLRDFARVIVDIALDVRADVQATVPPLRIQSARIVHRRAAQRGRD